jgi:hypothetical protein
MESCTKLPVSECTDTDWFVDPQNAVTAATAAVSPYVSPVINAGTAFKAGSTVDPPVPELQRFPRRVAFERVIDPANPQPWGITNAAGDILAGTAGRFRDNALWFAADNAGNVAYTAALPFEVNANPNPIPLGTSDGSSVPLPSLNSPSTATLPVIAAPTTDYVYQGSQPLLMPVLQLQGVTAAATGQPQGIAAAETTGWISQAVSNGTTFNLIVGAGDTPSRALDTANGDFNGGLQNLPRFLEIWSNGGAGTSISNNIKGSFIQQNRSAFSTAPYLPILPDTFVPANPVDILAPLFARSPAFNVQATPLPGSLPLITYNIQGARIPYFTPPARNWGFDVGLLSQPPDLFTQRFTIPSTRTQPAEYFREVGRDDEWVKTLMCGTVAPDLRQNANQNATSFIRRSECPT